MRPMPLFLDADGALLAIPLALGAIWPRLRSAELVRTLPEEAAFPSRIWFDPEVVEGLNELIGQSLVQPVWMTTWDDAANRLLAPALGVAGAPWPVATVGTRQGADAPDGLWVKTSAVGRWLVEQHRIDAPMVVVDDLLGDRQGGTESVQRRSIEQVNGAEKLLIAPHPQRGLQPQQVKEIGEFAKRYAAEKMA